MITSKDNEKIKILKELKRDKDYLFLDNPKLTQEAFNAGYKIEFLIVCEEKKNEFDLEKFGCEVIFVGNKLFEIFSSTINSQGIIAVVKNKERIFTPPNGNFLVLDNLQDPGNVGTLLRSAVGAGFEDVYIVDGVNALNDKLVRSSMGAIFKLNVFECEKNEFLAQIKNFKTPLYVCDMNGQNVFNFKAEKQFGLILGNEGNGVSNEMKKIATKTIAIPMKNNLESLNVAVAGSIVMFELTKNV